MSYIFTTLEDALDCIAALYAAQRAYTHRCTPEGAHEIIIPE